MPIDIAKTVSKYHGQWVAYKSDRKTVTAHARTAKEALQKAKEAGYEKPILARIPGRILNYVGAAI